MDFTGPLINSGERMGIIWHNWGGMDFRGNLTNMDISLDEWILNGYEWI